MNTFVSVFQQVVSMSLTSAFVITVVCLLRLCLKKTPKKFSYWLWAAAAFRLVCPFSIPAVFSLFTMTSAETVSEPGPVTQMSYLPSAYSTIEKAFPQSAITVPGEQLYTVGAPIPGTTAGGPWSVFAVLALLWVLGIVVLLAVAAASYARTKRRVGTAVKLYGNVYECDAIRSPFVLGFFRPRIYLPFGLDAEQRDTVLCHESTHIKRRDYLVKPLAFLLLTVHWFNPMVWLAFHLMSKDMEMSCDERVLELVGEDVRKSYSLSLLSFGTNRRFPSPNPLAFGETGVKERVKDVMTFHRAKLWVSVVAAAVCVVVTAACSTNPLEQSGASQTPDPSVPSAEAVKTVGLADRTDGNTVEILDLLFREADVELRELLETPMEHPPTLDESSQADASLQPSSKPSIIGIIGGADGPTTVYVDSRLTEQIDEYLRSYYPTEYFTEQGLEQFLKDVQANWSLMAWAPNGATLSLKEAERLRDDTTAVRQWTATVEAGLPDGTAGIYEISVKVQEEDGKISSLRLGEEFTDLQGFFQEYTMQALRDETVSSMEDELAAAQAELEALDKELSLCADGIEEMEASSEAREKGVAERLEAAKQTLKELSGQKAELEEKIKTLTEEIRAMRSIQVERVPSETSGSVEPSYPLASPSIPTPAPIPDGSLPSAQPVE